MFGFYLALGGIWLAIARRRSNDVIELIEADLEAIGIRYGIKHEIAHAETLP